MKRSQYSEEMASPTSGFAKAVPRFGTRFITGNVTMAGAERKFGWLRVSGKQTDQHGSQHCLQHTGKSIQKIHQCRKELISSLEQLQRRTTQ